MLSKNYKTRPAGHSCFHCYHICDEERIVKIKLVPIGATYCCKCSSASWYEEEKINHPVEVF